MAAIYGVKEPAWARSRSRGRSGPRSQSRERSPSTLGPRGGRKRLRTAPLPRAHHRGAALATIFEEADATCAHTAVALDYLRCTTATSAYQVTSASDDTVVACSAAWLTTSGYALDDVLGRGFRHLQGPRTDACAVRRVAASMAQGEPCEASLINYRGDGSVFANDFVIVPIRSWNDREPTHWLSVHGDAAALNWSPQSSPETPHRVVLVSCSSGSDRSRSKSSENSEDPSGGWLGLERARSRSGSPGSTSSASCGSDSLLASASPAALATMLRRAEAAEEALALMERRAEKAEAVFEARRATT